MRIVNKYSGWSVRVQLYFIGKELIIIKSHHSRPKRPISIDIVYYDHKKGLYKERLFDYKIL